MCLLSARSPARRPLCALGPPPGPRVGGATRICSPKGPGRRPRHKFPPQKQARVKELVDRYDVLSVLVASVLPPPFPFKLFVITAGVFELSLIRFTLAVAGGRAFRYFLEGFFAVRYGEQAMELFKKHYPAVGLGLAVLIIGFFLLRALLKRKKSGEAAGAEGQ